MQPKARQRKWGATVPCFSNGAGFFFIYIFLCAWACMYESAYVCMCTRIGCHMNHGVCCLISVSSVSHPHSSVRSSPRRHLIAVTIVTLCAFLKPARSLVSPAVSFLHAWPAVCREATCTLSQNGPVKKGFPVHYQKTWSSQRTHAHIHIHNNISLIFVYLVYLSMYVGHKMKNSAKTFSNLFSQYNEILVSGVKY